MTVKNVRLWHSFVLVENISFNIILLPASKLQLMVAQKNIKAENTQTGWAANLFGFLVLR